MMVSISMTKRKVLGSLHGLMGRGMKACGEVESKMELESTITSKELAGRVSGRKERGLRGYQKLLKRNEKI